MKPVLEVQELSQDFGGLRALNELSLTVNSGEIVALIGPNGAGKTTFFNCVTGIYTPTEGKMFLHDSQGEPRLLNGKKPHAITAMGMARTFQNIRLFNSMTVLENVMVGLDSASRYSLLEAALQNASRFARSQIALGCRKHPEGGVIFTVRDDGPGLAADALERVTQRGVRLDEREGSSGLGLAIVKRIASMHGGNVELRNRSGGGLEARVRLPLGLMLPRDAV